VPKPDVLEQSHLNMLQAAPPAWSGVSLRKLFTVSDDEIIGKSVNCVSLMKAVRGRHVDIDPAKF
jgi:hypothetical protein